MKNRREFLAGATVTLLMIPLGCGTDNASPSCDGAASTSSLAQGHTHTICVASVALSQPPTSGVSITTTVAAGHTHVVTLGQIQLMTIAAGQSAAVTSSASSGHTHDFLIMRAPASTPRRSSGY